MNKRGLSDVVTVALIILLAIAAVVIVWGFVKPALENIGKQIETSCTSININAISCDATANTVRVENGAGTQSIDSVKITVYDSSNAKLATVDGGGASCSNLAPLDIATCSSTYDIVAGQKVGAAGVIGDVVCPVSQAPIDC